MYLHCVHKYKFKVYYTWWWSVLIWTSFDGIHEIYFIHISFNRIKILNLSAGLDKDKKRFSKKKTENVHLLPRREVSVHGHFLKEDSVKFCVCEKCGKVMVEHSLPRHLKYYHGPGIMPPPDPSTKLISDLKRRNKQSSKNKKKSESVNFTYNI